jgi:hypothetical protein
MALKEPKVRSKPHRMFVASLPCCVSGIEGQTQCAHIRANTGGGMGLKPSDQYCVPLSVSEHARQHRIGEYPFWGERLPYAKELALDLFRNSGNRAECLKLIDLFKWKTLGMRT